MIGHITMVTVDNDDDEYNYHLPIGLIIGKHVT